MTEYYCPEKIRKLFDREDTKPEGRRLVIAWIKTCNMQVGDICWIPDNNGQLTSMLKERPATN